MTSTVANKLADACKLIERGWCRRDFAQDAAGYPVSVASDDATAFCALGANWRVCAGAHDYQKLDAYLERAIGTHSVDDWNDAPERTKSEVIAAFKRAEQLARGGAE